jgi:hypothetical protein
MYGVVARYNIPREGFAHDLKVHEQLESDPASTRSKAHEEWPLGISVVRRIDRRESGAEWKGFMGRLGECIGDIGEVVPTANLAVELISADDMTDMLNHKFRHIARDPKKSNARREVAKDVAGQINDTLGGYERAQVSLELSLLSESPDLRARAYDPSMQPVAPPVDLLETEQTVDPCVWGAARLILSEVGTSGNRMLVLPLGDEAGILSENRQGVLRILHDDLGLDTSSLSRRTYRPEVTVFLADRSLAGQDFQIPTIPYDFPTRPPRAILG